MKGLCDQWDPVGNQLCRFSSTSQLYHQNPIGSPESAFPLSIDLLLGLVSCNPKLINFIPTLPGTKKFDACNHVRAYQYYKESLAKSKGFVGYPCSNKDTFASVSLWVRQIFSGILKIFQNTITDTQTLEKQQQAAVHI